MASTGTVRVVGLRELQRDFKRISKDLDRGLTAELKQAAEPVATLARQLALGEIRNITYHWADTRVGVSRARGQVYVVPRARRRANGSPRPNLKGLLLGEAYDPALARKQGEVLRKLEDFVDRVADNNGF